MFDDVVLPFWVLVLVLGFAGIAALDRVLIPSVRWFFRRRLERAVARLNERLERPIEPFRLMRRQDQVIRLIYDPHVMAAVREYSETEGIPPNVAFDKARSYAREIVPGFSTATYFGFATKLAQRISQGLYDVRLGGADSAQLEGIDRRASVVFVMNHRSNMDYVLITWLASQHSALSYAVGEWARIWPLKALIRAMGAYFIRRRYSNTLYRAILARYVQMSIQQGTTQAIFPEGGLSLNGQVGKAKLGILSYILRGASGPDGPDVVFVPVALSYDRVLEDRVLISAGMNGMRRFPVRIRVALGFAVRILWQKLRGRFSRFGYAAVCYGKPLSLHDFQNAYPDAETDALAAELMTRIRAAVPVLPVPLVAAAVQRAGGPLSRDALEASCAEMSERLITLEAWLQLPDDSVPNAVKVGLQALVLRGILVEKDGQISHAPEEEAALAFYAGSVLQRLDAPHGPAEHGTRHIDRAVET